MIDGRNIYLDAGCAGHALGVRRANVPSVSDHLHPLAWCPLKDIRPAWHKWLGWSADYDWLQPLHDLFGVMIPPIISGPIVSADHNLRVHCALAFCSLSHPSVSAWLTACPCSSLMFSWGTTVPPQTQGEELYQACQIFSQELLHF